MSPESAAWLTDVDVNFTRHAARRLRERFGVAFDELKKLLHNFFNFESFSISGQTHWRMVVPLRYCFIGTFEGNCFVVKTVFFNINQTARRALGKVKRLRVRDISYPRLPESSFSSDLCATSGDDWL
ncbi:MAG: hypothetical protein WED04_12150 [Promethearchaeati archaeon SRVP18_Atabeyarchaeia-1]